MRISIHVLLLLLPLVCLAQKEDRIWVFGHNAGIDFNDTANPVNFVADCKNYKTASSIADSSGNLLFYLSCDLGQNRCDINNKNHIAISGLENINGFGGTGTCSAIIPFPNGIYYVLYIGRGSLTCSSTICPLLYYSIIELNPNGQFIVHEKDSILIDDFSYEQFAVVKHANGIDWWLVLPALKTINGFCTNRKHVFLFERNKIYYKGAQDIGNVICSSNKDGDMTFSPDGSKVIMSYYRDSLVEIYDFDRCSGMLYNPKIVDTTSSPYFVAISPNNKVAYVSKGKGGITTDNNLIYQYCLDSVDIPATRKTIWEDTTQLLHAGFLRLGANNKIYFSCAYGTSGLSPHISPYSRNLGVIHSPDEVGAACDFRPFSYYLGDSALATFGLPNMPNYNLGPLPIYQASAGVDTFYCASDSTIKALPIGGDSVPHIIYQWQPAPGIDTLTNRTQLVAPPPQSRWYYVTITDTNYVGPSCNSRVDSVYIEVRTCTGIPETQTLQAKLYPNPTTGMLTIELPTGQEGTVSLYNLLGQDVFHTDVKGTATLQIDLPKGVYIYRIDCGGKMLNGRLLVE